MRVAPVDARLLKDWGKPIPKGCNGDRDAFILQACRSRRTLHLGAADAPFHLEKAGKGALLHQRLQEVTGDLIGLDLDAEAIASLKEHAGITDIFQGDVMCPPTEHAWFDRPFEVVLCCDVIEHVANPGLLLSACKEYLEPGGQLIVTTVNATGLKPALRAIGGREAVHPEHVAYYSFSTLCVLLERCGLIPVEFGTFCYPARWPAAGWIFDHLARLAPGVADGLLVTATRRAT